MTAPHERGVELASGYVSVNVKTEDGIERLKSDLKGVESQAELSGAAAGKSLVDHIAGAGEPAAQGFRGALAAGLQRGLDEQGEQAANTFRGRFAQNMVGWLGGSRDIGELHGKALSAGIAAGAEAESRGGIFAPIAAGMRQELDSLDTEALSRGQKLGASIMGGLASAMENGPGLIGRGTRTAMSEVEEAGSTAFGAFAGAGAEAAERVKGGMAGIGGAALGLVSGPMAGLIAAMTTIGGAFEVLKGGFEHLEAIEDFESRLHALGVTAEQTKGIIESIETATKGTAFTEQDLFGVGQRAFQQGLSGQGLTEYLTTLENAAAVSNQSVDGISRFIDRIRTVGSITMPRQLTQLTSTGLPISTWLKQDLGLTDQQFDQFIKQHKLTYDVFMQELQKHTANGAADMSKTIGAQTHIMAENIDKIGGALLKPFFGNTGGFLQTINQKLEGVVGTLEKPDVQSTIKKVGDFITDGVKGVFTGISTVFDGLKSYATKVIVPGAKDIFQQFMSGASPGGFDWNKLQQEFKKVISDVVKALPLLEHGILSCVHALANVAHAVGNVVHALGNLMHAVGNVVHAVDNVIDVFVKVFEAGKNLDGWLLSLPGKFGEMIEHVGGAMIDKIGGIFSNFHPTIFGHKFAGGGVLPGQAVIQSPVGTNGLVQWAEPSTHGEAFIPLSPSNRERSQDIWLQTGALLGMLGGQGSGLMPGMPLPGDQSQLLMAMLGLGQQPTAFADGGITGGRGGGTSGSVEDVLGRFVDMIHQSSEGLKGVNDGLKKLQGSDFEGGIGSLTEAFKSLAPSVKTVADGLNAAKNAGPVSLPGRPEGGLRGMLGRIDAGSALDRGRSIAESAQGWADTLGAEAPWLQTAADTLRHGRTLHHYWHGHDQTGHSSPGGVPRNSASKARTPETLEDHLTAQHPAHRPIGQPAHLADLAGSALPFIGTINSHRDWFTGQQSYSTTGLDNAAKTVQSLGSHIPGMGVLDNVLNKYPKAAGQWLRDKLGFADGGFLPGNSDRDNMLGMISGKTVFGLAGGEGIVKTAVAQQPLVKALINWLNGGMKGHAGGTDNAGYDFVSSMSGTPYSQADRDDCSGMASQVINSFLGLPPRSSLFTTRNEREWLSAHGFIMGQGPKGTLRVGWYNHGSAPDDGHTALTLPDGTPVESGGQHGNFMAGGGAAGADNPEFDEHAYLPMNAQGQAYGGSASGGSAGGSGGYGGVGGSGGSPAAAAGGTLAQAGFSAFGENLPTGFSNPLDWGAVKSGAALFKFFGAVGKAQGNPGASVGLTAIGDVLSGSGSGLVNDISSLGAFGPVGIGSPQDASALTPANMLAGAGGGLPNFVPPGQPGSPEKGSGTAGQGEGVTVNHNSHYHGDINDDGRHQQAKAAKDKRTTTKTIQLQRNDHG